MDATELAARLLEPIPANRSFGLRVLRAVDGEAEVEVVARPEFANVIGSLHSSGLAALVDATGLAALVAAAAEESQFDGVVPLGTAARLEFLAPARGRLIGRCALDSVGREAVAPLFDGTSDRAQLSTEVEVLDESGTVVCRGSFHWKVRQLDERA